MSSNENENENEILSIIQNKFPCRTKQIRQLFHYMNLKDTNNIIINGPRATGKTSVIKILVEQFKLFHVWFDMVSLDNNDRSFYEKILYQMSIQIKKIHEIPTLEDNEKNIKCLNHSDFLDNMINLLKSYQSSLNEENVKILRRKFFLILDNADILIDENHENLIYLLNNINQFTNGICSISVLWICKYQLERLFRVAEFKLSALQVNFPPYTQEELSILLTDPSLIPYDPYKLYKSFVSLIIKTLIPFENNFLNLKFICLKYFNQYIQPVEDEQVTLYQTGQLYLRFQGQLHEIINQIGGDIINGLNKNIQQYIRTLSPSMCYTYVSIYLATYNSTQTDIRFFVRNQKSRYRSKKFKKNLHSIKDSEKCPKWFELERAFHIYRALVELNEKDKETRSNLLIQDSQFFRQLADLLDCKILLCKSVTNKSCAGDAKYQLSQVITDNMILNIASRIDLNINIFLNHHIEPNFF